MPQPSSDDETGTLRASSEQPKRAVTRRRLVLAAAASLGLSEVLAATAIRSIAPKRPAADPAANIFGQVVPEEGVDIGVRFGDAVQKMIAAGALDPGKLRALGYGLPPWVEQLLAAPSQEPIVFTRDRAPYLVTLLWPIGLSNKAPFNRGNPINTAGLAGLASTGGWTLGRAPNGSAYYNKVDAVKLTERQALLALAVAMNTFRPCCDNSTFSQDCNHGSALLGLIELAAAQGATADAIYGMALTANSYWFPEQYARTAQYFLRFANRPWKKVSAPLVMSAAYSSLSGWRRHVDSPLWRTEMLPPRDPTAQPAACGI